MMTRRARRALLGAGLLAGAVALGGCLSNEEEAGRLDVQASWRGAQHLDVNVENVGGSPVSMSGMDAMRLDGPNGAMVIHWSGMAPTLAPGESRAFDLHAMHMEDGTIGVAMDHMMAQRHMTMPPGDYTLTLAGATATAPLAAGST